MRYFFVPDNFLTLWHKLKSSRQPCPSSDYFGTTLTSHFYFVRLSRIHGIG